MLLQIVCTEIIGRVDVDCAHQFCLTKLRTDYLQATYMACKVDYQTCFLDIRWLIHEQNLLARSCPTKVQNI
jgi:hypothetical protein